MRKTGYIFVLIGIVLSAGYLALRPDATPEQPPAPASSRLSELLGSTSGEDFPLALAPRAFDFPADHGPHPDYRNEWWYVTGNLDDTAGRRYGFELTLFRFALTPEPAGDRSAWRSNQVFIGHFALTDAADRRFYVGERYARAALGLAGAEPRGTRIWLEDWEMGRRPGADTGTPAQWSIDARDADFGISLILEPRKAPVLHGEDGLSRKSAEPGNASYYYSLTRLAASGSVVIAGDSRPVTGQAWLDREWGSSALARNQAGWDWFALQFDDGTELMFYQLRRVGGEPDPMSAGTWIRADGRTRPLAADDVRIDVLDRWQSPMGGLYPMGWQIDVPSIGLDVRIRPVLKAQELVTSVRYWEGAVDLAGSRGDNPVTGRGYVELTGYADDAQERGR